MKFKKKPVVIDAVQWTGKNLKELMEFALTADKGLGYQEDKLFIPTLEGTMTAEKFDWIIKGVAGELYPCKPEIFEKTYEPVVDAEPSTPTASGD